MYNGSVADAARLIFLLTLAHCGHDTADFTAASTTTQDAIVGGDATEEPAAVGMITSLSDAEMMSCTGTVIAPHTMLTAAHCILAFQGDGKAPLSFLEPSKLVVYVSADLTKVKEGDFHPVSDVTFPAVDGRPLQPEDFLPAIEQRLPFASDVALIHVSKPFLQKPLAVAARPPQAGDGLSLIGYGSTGNALTGVGRGTRRRTYVRIFSTYEETHFMAGNRAHGACVGDSGGPALFDDAVVGIVHSAVIGRDGSCLGGSVFIRTDAWAKFIKENSY